jgi:thioredoxin-related protein
VLFELPGCSHCEKVKKIFSFDEIRKVTDQLIKTYSLTTVPVVIIFDDRNNVIEKIDLFKGC